MYPTNKRVSLGLTLLLWVACVGAYAQEQPADADPDAMPTNKAIPRNMDFIGPSVRAATRSKLSRMSAASSSNVAAAQTSATQPILGPADLRMLIARRLPVQYNICAVSIGGGRAGAPMLRGNVDNNCVLGNVAIVNGTVRGW